VDKRVFPVSPDVIVVLVWAFTNKWKILKVMRTFFILSPYFNLPRGINLEAIPIQIQAL
jgi:hypothetical protein